MSAALREIASSKKAKPAQIALASVLEKGDDIVPIPGATRRSHLEENIAAERVRVDADEMQALDEALGPGKIAEPRHPDPADGDHRSLAGLAQRRHRPPVAPPNSDETGPNPGQPTKL